MPDGVQLSTGAWTYTCLFIANATKPPDVPTFTEQGFPDIPSNAWFSLFAPAGMKPEMVKTISDAARAAMRRRVEGDGGAVPTLSIRRFP